MTRRIGRNSCLPVPPRRADRFWLAQAMLVLLALLPIGFSVVHYSEPLTDLAALCQRTVRTLIVPDLAAIKLLPSLLGALGAMLGMLSVWRQWRATRRLLNALGPTQPLPQRLVIWERHLKLEGRLRLAADTRPLAFCAGLIHPVVWLTTGLLSALDEDGLGAVLRHEAHHVRRHDPLKVLLVRASADAFFFLPTVRDLGRSYQVHKELAADAEAVLSPDGQRGLARALVRLLSDQPRDLESAAVGNLMALEPYETIPARLLQLTSGKVTAVGLRRRSLATTTAALALFFAITLVPLSRPSASNWGGSCAPQQVATLLPWPEAR